MRQDEIDQNSRPVLTRSHLRVACKSSRIPDFHLQCFAFPFHKGNNFHEYTQSFPFPYVWPKEERDFHLKVQVPKEIFPHGRQYRSVITGKKKRSKNTYEVRLLQITLDRPVSMQVATTGNLERPICIDWFGGGYVQKCV